MKFIDSDPYKKLIGNTYKGINNNRIIEFVGYAYNKNENKYIFILELKYKAFGNRSQELISYISNIAYDIKYFNSNSDGKYVFMSDVVFYHHYTKII